MKFGEFPLERCEGAILAHAVKMADGKRLPKGLVLNAGHLASLKQNGTQLLSVAILEAGDVGEDIAATRIAALLGNSNIEVANAGTGRVNLFAKANGVFCVDRKWVDGLNLIDPGITLATLNDKTDVLAGRMVATVKIIPYAVPGDAVDVAKQIAGQNANGGLMQIKPYSAKRIGVISTKLPSLKDSTITKTIAILERRLAPSGSRLVEQKTIGHDTHEVADALRQMVPDCDMIIVFGASAISDQRDVIPQALEKAGGTIIRFGMPVDPGNLLLLGELGGKPVIGAPGCARSPAENGFDFVLQQLLAGIKITFADIAGMGVGGLLMEIGSRPSPREKTVAESVSVAAIILAAGQSRRMGRQNKLLATLAAKPLLRHVVDAADESQAKPTIIVTGHQHQAIIDAVRGAVANFVHNADFAEGLATSLRCGIMAVPASCSHALVLLGDMPGISAAMLDQMIAAAKTSPAGSIVMATHFGKRGNPVLWPRAYFEALSNISGDIGARHVLFENHEKIVEVELGEAACLDVDTPAALKEIGSKLVPGK